MRRCEARKGLLLAPRADQSTARADSIRKMIGVPPLPSGREFSKLHRAAEISFRLTLHEQWLHFRPVSSGMSSSMARLCRTLPDQLRKSAGSIACFGHAGAGDGDLRRSIQTCTTMRAMQAHMLRLA